MTLPVKPIPIELPFERLAPPGYLAAALEAIRVLRGAGHAAFFVGGCVRDAMLGQPVKDIDIAASARPEQTAGLFREARAVGAHFGVQLVRRRAPDGAEHQFEVAAFRAEGAYVDNRHPALDELRFGTLAEDYQRRDFTVNAMYYDPLARELTDPAGGRGDLERRLLRAVGEPERRFSEDALRLMRAVRFAARFAFTLEPATAAAIRRLGGLLAAISVERVADELLKSLTGPRPGAFMRLMAELGLWAHVIPEIEPLRGCAQPANFHPEGDVFEHTARVLDEARAAWSLQAREAAAGEAKEPAGAPASGAMGGPPPELMLAALLHDVGKPPTFMITDRIRFPNHHSAGAALADSICRRLRLSNEARELTVALVGGHMRFMEAQNMRPSTLRRFMGQPRFDLHLALHRADVMASNHFLENYEFCRAWLRALREGDGHGAVIPLPLLRGGDLIALGLKPGPRFKELLREAHDAQMEGRFADRAAALAWAREKLA